MQIRMMTITQRRDSINITYLLQINFHEPVWLSNVLQWPALFSVKDNNVDSLKCISAVGLGLTYYIVRL